MSKWVDEWVTGLADWLTAWLAATCFHMISTRRTGEKQGKRKPSTRPRPNRDSKDSLEQEKETGQQAKKKKKYEKNGTPKGMFGGKVLTGLRVKKSQAQDLTRCLGNSYGQRIRRHQKDIATGGAFPLRFPPQGIQTIDLSHWNCCVEWSLSCFVLAWNGVLLLPSFLGLIVYQNANLNNYE